MYPVSPKLGLAHLGASTFFASAHPSESCGSNGLPLTPNSIRIYGRARALHLINHPHLCSYVDIHRGKHERIMVIQEYYLLNLRTAVQKYSEFRSYRGLAKLAHQVLQGLVYLNNFGTVNCNLSPDNILIDPCGRTKLYNYGLHYMTEAATAVSFPLGSIQYTAPEILLQGGSQEGGAGGATVSGNPAWDVWSLGIILTEIIMGCSVFGRHEKVERLVSEVLRLSLASDPLLHLAQTHDAVEKINRLPEDMRGFLQLCLTVDPEDRPVPRNLLSHSLFQPFVMSASLIPVPPHFPVIDPSLCLIDFSQYKAKLGLLESEGDHLTDYPLVPDNDSAQQTQTDEKPRLRNGRRDQLCERPMREVYHLWQLAGGNVEQELKKQKLVRIKPAILTLPSVMVVEGEVFGGGIHRRQLLETTTIILPLHNLRNRLAHIPPEKYYPLITQGECGTDELETSQLPLVIRERDVEYQFHRLLIFERLLQSYPFKAESILREARKDTPPFYRALVWASLLGVDGPVAQTYQQIDKETPTPTDRQIEVDIPRCHQYDELLSSPQGHAKFTRVLKAWVVSHAHLVYWQGLDSLCAPFLYLNFNNEALAYACLSQFIDKYLHKFFLRDNSAVIQEYLAKFSHMIAFHDPQLFNHLDNIGFIPELYAIPWFLTMYTHVFPLQKIFLLWDTLLLGEASLPLCIGVALLRQLKDRLLQFGFNECILLFSDMPDIDMERVVRESVQVFCSTPPSVTFRQHERPRPDPSKLNSSPHLTEACQDLVMDAVPVVELKREKCPRACGADLLELLAHKRSRSGRAKVLVVDIRSPDEFARGMLTDAINLPAESSITSEGLLNPSSQTDILNSYRGKIICVMGSRNNWEQVVKFAETLLAQEFPRVCTLHQGVEVFRASGALVVRS
ncbi:TBC domain-containing protein kinase-like protein [Homarus americanus]|uniref:TBC domain-containing protein kinase-like protein n=1 Tax=Homarus americanus TaxID=6706 RepID=UPI001C47FC87|nr:TBC domain-containing protein kinase-like protein [Homarus americanus]